MVADEPFELTFLDDVGAIYVQVLYFKRFGGPLDGKTILFLFFFVGIDPCGNHSKDGTYTVTTDL